MKGQPVTDCGVKGQPVTEWGEVILSHSEALPTATRPLHIGVVENEFTA